MEENKELEQIAEEKTADVQETVEDTGTADTVVEETAEEASAPSLDTPISTGDPYAYEEEETERRPQSSPFMLLRVLAGGYLMYLAYRMLKDMFATGDRKWYIFLFAALFLAIGPAIIIFTIRGYLRASKADREYAERQAEREERKAAARAERAKAEGRPALDSAKSITERLKMLNEADGVDTEEILPEAAEEEEAAAEETAEAAEEAVSEDVGPEEEIREETV